jgi:hypothetical protein
MAGWRKSAFHRPAFDSRLAILAIVAGVIRMMREIRGMTIG